MWNLFIGFFVFGFWYLCLAQTISLVVVVLLRCFVLRENREEGKVFWRQVLFWGGFDLDGFCEVMDTGTLVTSAFCYFGSWWWKKRGMIEFKRYCGWLLFSSLWFLGWVRMMARNNSTFFLEVLLLQVVVMVAEPTKMALFPAPFELSPVTWRLFHPVLLPLLGLRQPHLHHRFWIRMMMLTVIGYAWVSFNWWNLKIITCLLIMMIVFMNCCSVACNDDLWYLLIVDMMSLDYLFAFIAEVNADSMFSN